MNNPLEWKGLLKWSLQYHDGTAPTDSAPMSEEKRKFLEDVMASLVVDESKRIVEIIDMLMDGIGGALEQDEDRVEEIFDELEDIVCQIDYANFFIKLNGLFAISELLKSESELMRERALSIVSTVAQNNPEAQAAVHNFQGKAFFTGLIEHCRVETDGRAKAACLSGVSAVLTNFEAAENTFFESEGLRTLAETISGAEDRDGNLAGRKANFVAKKFFMLDNPRAEKTRMLADSLLGPLIGATGVEDDDRREKALEAIAPLLGALAEVGAAVGEADRSALLQMRRARAERLAAVPAEGAEAERELWASVMAALDGAGPSGSAGVADPVAETGAAETEPPVLMIGMPAENLPQ